MQRLFASFSICEMGRFEKSCYSEVQWCQNEGHKQPLFGQFLNLKSFIRLKIPKNTHYIHGSSNQIIRY